MSIYFYMLNQKWIKLCNSSIAIIKLSLCDDPNISWSPLNDNPFDNIDLITSTILVNTFVQYWISVSFWSNNFESIIFKTSILSFIIKIQDLWWFEFLREESLTSTLFQSENPWVKKLTLQQIANKEHNICFLYFKSKAENISWISLYFLEQYKTD